MDKQNVAIDPDTMIEATDNGSTFANACSSSSIPDSPPAIAPVERIASAVIDISDGLVADLGHIARASGVEASITLDRVPFSAAALAAIALNPALVEAAITGGDDYELLFTSPASQADRIEDLSKNIDLALTRIGSIDRNGGKGEPVRVINEAGGEILIKNGGYHLF